MTSYTINGIEYIRKDVHEAQMATAQRQRETDYHTLGKSFFQMVRDFHERFGLVIGSEPMDMSNEREVTEAEKDLFNLRGKLHTEEWNELADAYEGENLSVLAKEICDVIVVLCGTAVSFGIPLDECFAEVHRSNMSKLGEDGKPLKREDGKVLKGPNYSPPDLRSIIYDSQKH